MKKYLGLLRSRVKNAFQKHLPHCAHCFGITRLPLPFQQLWLLHTTQLPDILPPNEGNYELQVLHLELFHIAIHIASS